ncbi:hypothetical protein EV693_10250 [Nicoletella semolina]|uniref:Uncharacterized protein n=1 Tax=Nicoletella semolina TaxID=271160 RepID=A0A4R2NB64_9PAST|nr:hypothetical protein EV693_10250 [Nicoletella semolina]
MSEKLSITFGESFIAASNHLNRPIITDKSIIKSLI